MNNKNIKSLLTGLALLSAFPGGQVQAVWPESTAGKVGLVFAAGTLVGACVYRYCFQNQLIEDAAYRGDADALRRHAALGGDVEQAATGGHTLLRKNVDEGNCERIRALCEAGADVNRVDDEGWTPLMGAAHHGKLAVVRELLNARANVNHNNFNGYGALKVAVREKFPAIVCALLSAGADVPGDLESRDHEIQHLLGLARDGNREEIARLARDVYAEETERGNDFLVKSAAKR